MTAFVYKEWMSGTSITEYPVSKNRPSVLLDMVWYGQN